MPKKNNSFRTEPRDIKDSYLQQVRIKRVDTELQNVKQELKNERLIELSRPTSTKEKYRRPPSPKHTVHKAALTYKATDRIINISKPKRSFSPSQKEIVPGSVKPEALEHETTGKEYELSVPRSWKVPHDSNNKEYPFSTSKAAMRYIATPRTMELAKPAERKF